MKIRFGTFNLFQFVEPPYSWYSKEDKFNQKEWLQKTAWIKNQIRKMDCDIIGFQEVFSLDALKTILEDTGFKYFETVDKAQLSDTDKYTYISTTVAIASKYPISNIQIVEIDDSSIKKHYIQSKVKFSRIPIKASITLPNKKEILVYVCHLKSNRLSEFEYWFTNKDSLTHKKELTSKIINNKDTSSLKQRLCEASSLFIDMNKTSNIPKVLLCDLNDKEFSLSIDALIHSKYHNEDSEEKSILNDAAYEYNQANPNPKPEAKVIKRKPTSYFKGRGDVLDYIFISNDFIENRKDNIAYVSNYSIFDEHLEKDKDGSLLKSDHAQVVCELTFLLDKEPK